MQEPEGDVEGGAAPHLERVRPGQRVSRRGRRREEVAGAHPRGERRLVRIAPRGIHQQQPLVVPNRLGERRRSLLVDDLLEPRGRRLGRGLRRDGLDDDGRGAHRPRMARAVDRDVREVAQELGHVVLGGLQVEQRRRRVDKVGGEFAGEERLGLEDVEEERDVGLDPAHAKLAERAVHLLDDGHEVLLLARELDEEGVVVWGHAAADDHLAVEADAHAAGGAVHLHLAKVGRERHLGVLGRDAALHGETLDLDVVLGLDADVFEGGAARDENLRLHQVDAGHLLRHRVLHLDAGVHLEEVVATLLVHHELDRAGVAVVDVLRQPHRVVVQGLPQRRVQDGSRRQLDHLLVPSLHGAIALVQVHHVSVPVGEDLNLDVPRSLDVPLQEHASVAERRERLGRRARERILELTHGPHDPHAAAAPAHCRLEHDRHAKLLRKRLRRLDVVRRLLRAGDQGQAALLRE